MRHRSLPQQAQSVLGEPVAIKAEIVHPGRGGGEGGAALCGPVEDNTDYWAQNLASEGNVTSPARCCESCRRNPKCRAWTWGKVRNVAGLSDVCFLKGLSPGQGLLKQPSPNTKSGTPFRSHGDASASMFCLSVAAAPGVELQLLAVQHRRRTGIFACDEYAVYSSEEVELSPGSRTTPVESSFNAAYLKEAGTWLNCMDFSAVWRKITLEGRFRFHNWTVKVDPDTVFLPSRLRHRLQGAVEADSGVYFNNCEGRSMRGSIEVLSRRAVQAHALGCTRCTQGEEKLNFSTWGEDTLMDQCLSRVLKVQRLHDYLLVSDGQCNASAGQDCSRKDFVAFHPFRTAASFEGCLTQAVTS